MLSSCRPVIRCVRRVMTPDPRRQQVNAAALAAAQAQHGGGDDALQLDLDDIGRWGYPKVGSL